MKICQRRWQLPKPGMTLSLTLLLSWQLLTFSVASADIILLSASEDARILSVPAVPQLENTNFGAESLLSVHTQPGNTQRSLFRFDIASVPANQQIDSAILTLFRNSSLPDSGNPSNRPMTVHQITKAWSESTVTWNIASTGNPWSTSGGDFGASSFGTSSANPTSNQPLSWDVTGLVQSWYSGSAINHGLLLQSTLGNELNFFSDEFATASLRPSLSVTFTAVPEPSSLLLIGSLAAAAVCFQRSRRKLVSLA